MKRKSFLKTIKWVLILAPVLILMALLAANFTIKKEAKNLVYNNVSTIPHNRVGLLLGTSKYLASGEVNVYYANRISAATALFKARKIDKIVISGDNSTHRYNEPESMRADLLKAAIPESVIHLDYAGFRTFDSVIRLNKIFGQTHFTIISQQFHNERAICIARHYGLNAVGFNAQDVNRYYGFKTMVRELFARVKVFVDLLTDKQPKYLGEKIDID